MKKRKILLTALWSIVVLWVAFIWGNSMQAGDDSAQMSGTLARILNFILGNDNKHFDAVHLFVRKAAHFTEYAILSFLLCLAFYFTQRKEASKAYIPLHRDLSLLSLPCSFAVAATDEMIQLFTAGRHGSFLDVLLDTCGAAAAVCIFFVLMLIIQRRRMLMKSK